jgi:hypothetical protein
MALAFDVDTIVGVPSPKPHRAPTRPLFITKRHLVSVLGLGVLEGFALSVLKKMRL